MANAFDRLRESPVVASHVRRWISGPTPLEGRIHAADEMYRHALESLRGVENCAAILYYLKGYQIVSALRDSWGASPPSAVLDFASGFGRCTRFLIREVPPERIWVSEIQAGAVEFQQKVFGVHGLTSVADPEGFESEKQFPLIVASSFFSHVPPAKFQGWLERPIDHLEPQGHLLFSVHGSTLAPAVVDLSEGILFLPESESRALSPEEYGTTYVTEDYVREAVRSASGGQAGLTYIPFGFCGQQDLCLVSTVEAADRAEVGLFPRGDLLSLDRDSEILNLRGWVSCADVREDAMTVNLYLGSELRDSATASPDPGSADPDLSTWALRTETADVASSDVVAITAVTSRGLENVLAMGTLRSAGLA